MKKYFNIFGSLLLFAFILVSCNKKEDIPVASTKVTIEDLNATAWDKWVYFSFATGKEVTVTEPEKSMEWDVAFRRNNFRINGANGFNGKAQVCLTESEDFDAVSSSAAKAFVGNIEATIKASSGMGKPVQIETTYYVSSAPTFDKNTTLLFNVDMSKMMEGAAAMYPIVKKVFVFRSADGKSLYKFQMVRSVNSKGSNGGTLSFNYQKI